MKKLKIGLSLIVSMVMVFGLTACNQQTTSQLKNGGNANGSQTKNNTDTNSGQVPVTLIKVVDGDTIKVNYNGKKVTVRYLLVDTPEEKKPNTCVQPYAVDAANKNEQLLSTGKITLEFEKGNKYDKYGRLLAYVYVDGASVQETLLKQGYARLAYIYQPTYKYLDLFRKDESEAKAQKLNIWTKPGYVTNKGFNGCVNNSSSAKTKSL